MKAAIFNTKSYDEKFLTEANAEFGHDLVFYEVPLTPATSKLAHGFPVVCVFVNDVLDAGIIESLHAERTRLIALRCAGFNNVDLKAAAAYGIQVVRVPAYSPHGVAEHAVALMLSLNRKIYRSHNRVREGNFSLEGLLGFDLNRSCAGVIGTGKIGALVAGIMKGFGCEVIAYDPFKNPVCEAAGVKYVDMDDLFRMSDIISLHIPLTPDTHHMIDKTAISKMKKGVMLINTSRGGLVNTRDVIAGLKTGKIGYLGLDVYEEEEDYFFEDKSDFVIKDDVLARLLTFPNVIMTGHQAFFTREAMESISYVTLKNISDFEKGILKQENVVKLEQNKSIR